MNRSPARILGVTAGLVAGGALFGALAGALAITIVITPFGWSETFDTLVLEAAQKGAVLGAVLLPIAGWTLLRRVPLWRTLTGTIVGTVIGSLVGLVVLGFIAYPIGVLVGPVVGAVVGFLWAAVRLRRRFPVAREVERIRVPRGAGA
ncbi:MAG TPA: hypothetical protein VM890_11455 [Longimicrobium sp.]|jgi:hypothetical protein|nr:hypothetical protein [Longimicrobium sp.]